MRIELLKTLFVKLYVVFGSFLLVIQTANYLGAHNRGILGATLVIIGFSQTFFYMSFGQVIYSKLASNKYKDEISDVISQVNTYNIAVVPFISIFVSCLLYLYGVLSAYLLIISVFCIVTLIVEQQLTSISLCQGMNSKVNMIQVISKTIYFLSSYILVFYCSLSYLGILIGYTLSNCTSVLLLKYNNKGILKHVGKRVFVNFIPILKESIKLHLNAFGQALFTQAPLLIVGVFVLLNELASIEIAFKIISIYFVIGQATQQVILSKISKMSSSEALQTIKNMMKYSLFFLFISMLIGFLVIDIFVDMFLSEEFSDVVFMFKLMLPIVIPFCLNMILLSVYVKFELFYLASKNNMVIGSIASVSAILFSYIFGKYGFVVSYYLSGMAMLYFVMKVIKLIEMKVFNENSVAV